MAKEINTALFEAYGEHEPSELSDGEKALLFAILFSAIQDAKREGRNRRQAIEYFLSDEKDYLFSFHSICSYLNLDPTMVLATAGIQPRKVRITKQ